MLNKFSKLKMLEVIKVNNVFKSNCQHFQPEWICKIKSFDNYFLNSTCGIVKQYYFAYITCTYYIVLHWI